MCNLSCQVGSNHGVKLNSWTWFLISAPLNLFPFQSCLICADQDPIDPLQGHCSSFLLPLLSSPCFITLNTKI